MESNTITVAGKEITISNSEEISEEIENVSLEESEEIDEEKTTLQDLDEDDPIEAASKALYQACLATGQIPLTATALTLILNVESMQMKTTKKGEEKWETVNDESAVSSIVLTPQDRNTAISGLANSWISNLKKLVEFQKKLGPQITESQAEELDRVQSLYEKSLSEFKTAMKFLYSAAKEDGKVQISAASTGAQSILEAFKEIKAMKNAWAYEQFMLLPKAYIQYAIFAEEDIDSDE